MRGAGGTAARSSRRRRRPSATHSAFAKVRAASHSGKRYVSYTATLPTKTAAILLLSITTLLQRHSCNGYLSTIHLGRVIRDMRYYEKHLQDDVPRYLKERTYIFDDDQSLESEEDTIPSNLSNNYEQSGVLEPAEVEMEAHPSWAGEAEAAGTVDEVTDAVGSVNASTAVPVSETVAAVDLVGEEAAEGTAEVLFATGDDASTQGLDDENFVSEDIACKVAEVAHPEGEGIANDDKEGDDEHSGDTETAVPQEGEDEVMLGGDHESALKKAEEKLDYVSPQATRTTTALTPDDESMELDEMADTPRLDVTDKEQLRSPEIEETPPTQGVGLSSEAKEKAKMEEDNSSSAVQEPREDIKTEALAELSRLRKERDLQVQAAGEAAVEGLSNDQKEIFDELKAFAYGCSESNDVGTEDAPEPGLSAEEACALETVAICGDRNGVLLAFLRHSKFDGEKAKQSIRRCCKWRIETMADDMFARGVSPEKMRKHRTHWPTGFHKEDRLGRPVFYDRVGSVDLATLRADPDGLDQDDMVQIFCQNMEARRRFVLTRFSLEAGRPVDQMTTVLDLSGMGIRHMSKEALSYTRRIGDIFNDNYSGMTSSLLVVNTPWVFSKGWQMIEGFLSEDTVAKVKVLGKGEAGLEKLAEYIPKEHIPDFLGGPSRTTVGPGDPLWADVDHAMTAWANCEDPFFDPRVLGKIEASLRRERATRDAADTAQNTVDGLLDETAAPESRRILESFGEDGHGDVFAGVQKGIKSVEEEDRFTVEGDVHVQGTEAPRTVEERTRALSAEWKAEQDEIHLQDAAREGVRDGGSMEKEGKKATITAGRRARRRSDSIRVTRARPDGKRGKLSTGHGTTGSHHNKHTLTGRSARDEKKSARRTAKATPSTGRKPASMMPSRRRQKESNCDSGDMDTRRRRARGHDKDDDKDDDKDVQEEGAAHRSIGELFSKNVVPAVRAALLHLAATCVLLLKMIGALLRYLRDALFEQVEAEDE